MNQRLKNATDTARELVAYYVLLLIISASWFSVAEGVDFIFSLYWAAITSTSVGYGDISPKTGWGMIDAVLTSFISLFVITPLIVAKWLDYFACKRDQEEMKALLRQIHDDLNRPL
jgi:voltage-gated potassium channel